jgi:hypothetical protein
MNIFRGYALDYIKSRAESSAIHSQGSRNRRHGRFVDRNQVSHSGREDTRSPIGNGASLRQSSIVSCYS